MFAFHVLASGSHGNASIIEDVETGHGILLDCGICKRDLFSRSAEASFDLEKLDGILITHNHSDHVSGLGVVARGLKRQGLPLFVLPPLFRQCAKVNEARSVLEVQPMEVDTPFVLGSITVTPFRTSHDALASCGFRFQLPDGDVLGYVTDTGMLDDRSKGYLAGARILALESNHDAQMLKEGPYPAALKARIASKRGHLSNDQASEALDELVHLSLEHVVAMHLSENNNLPSLARESLESILDERGSAAQVTVAAQYMLKSVR